MQIVILQAFMGHAWALQIGKTRLYPLKLQLILYWVWKLKQQLYQKCNISGADQPDMHSWGQEPLRLPLPKAIFTRQTPKSLTIFTLPEVPTSKGMLLALFLEGNWGTEGLNKLLQDTQEIRVQNRKLNARIWSPSPLFYSLPCKNDVSPFSPK